MKKILKYTPNFLLVSVILSTLLIAAFTNSSFVKVASIACGGYHSIALKWNWNLWTWGQNQYGQLGDETNITRLFPKRINNIPIGIEKIAGGGYHTVVVQNNGNVWTWGQNKYGQLGDGTNIDKNYPVIVLGFDGTPFMNVDTAVAGKYHTVFLRHDGTIWTCGDNRYGQLGIGVISTNSAYPVQVINLNGIVEVASGNFHNLALKSDSSVWSWGRNDYGQLGDGSNTDRTTPIKIFDGAIAIGCGGFHSIIVDKYGDVWAFGWNSYGQLGNETNINSNKPVKVKNLNYIISVDGGEYHSIALSYYGYVYTWGNNKQGQLGIGDYYDRNIPVIVWKLENIVQISAGWFHNIALEKNGNVWAWGDNAMGQLGNGMTFDNNLPIKIFIF